MSDEQKSAEVSVAVFGEDCSCPEITADDLENVAIVMAAAARALRAGKHGTIFCYDPANSVEIANVGIVQPGVDLPDGKPLPVLRQIAFRRKP